MFTLEVQSKQVLIGLDMYPRHCNMARGGLIETPYRRQTKKRSLCARRAKCKLSRNLGRSLLTCFNVSNTRYMTLNSLSSMIRENSRGKIDSKIFLLQRPKGSNRFDLPWFPPCGKYWVTFTKANHCHDFAAANVSSALPYTSFTFTTWSHFFSFSPANKVHRVRRNNMSVQKVFKVVFSSTMMFDVSEVIWRKSQGPRKGCTQFCFSGSSR